MAPSPNSDNDNNNGNKKSNSNNNGDLSGGWGFLQALTETSKKNDDVYVHPLVKRSASKLTEKSLKMCTESLGSETGSDISETGGDDIFSDGSADNSPKSQHSRIRGAFAAVKKTHRRAGDFPPPLTSISGSAGVVRVKPHREGGRLVIKAVTVSSTQAYFHAERTDGRLRLHLLRDNFQNSKGEAAAVAEEREEEEEEEVEDECCGDDDGEEEEEDDSVCWGEDMDDNNENVVGEIGMENYSKPSRCKEGDGHNRNNKGYIWNLEACWVATS